MHITYTILNTYSAAGAGSLSAIPLSGNSNPQSNVFKYTREIPPKGWHYLETSDTRNGIF